MKKIAVITATRAEYGLLRPIIMKLKQCDDFTVEVVATGAHLSPEFGLTYKEIENDGIEIAKKIEILLSSDTAVSISKSMGLAMISFAEYFDESKPDAVVVLGDRYETLAVCCAAMNARVPIVHLYGGETTEGAIDEAVRHAITKMSYLHFTSTEPYRKRVIQLGENPSRVYCVGAVGIENALNVPLMSEKELSESVGMELNGDYAVLTFHPVTLEGDAAREQFAQLLKALDANKDMKFIITKANADANGRIINRMIDEYAAENDNVVAFQSLGMRRYLSALKYCKMVIGNSSSGLLEVPTFKVPTVNIGDRQKGRIQAKSVINCEPNYESICKAVEKAKSEEFQKTLADVVNPYGDGKTSDKIVAVMREKLCNFKYGDLKKKFYDIDF